LFIVEKINTKFLNNLWHSGDAYMAQMLLNNWQIRLDGPEIQWISKTLTYGEYNE